MRENHSFEPLTRKDKTVYWLMRLTPLLGVPDWRPFWREYMRTRRFWGGAR